MAVIFFGNVDFFLATWMAEGSAARSESKEREEKEKGNY
jgi:hypothetical protein